MLPANSAMMTLVVADGDLGRLLRNGLLNHAVALDYHDRLW